MRRKSLILSCAVVFLVLVCLLAASCGGKSSSGKKSRAQSQAQTRAQSQAQTTSGTAGGGGQTQTTSWPPAGCVTVSEVQQIDRVIASTGYDSASQSFIKTNGTVVCEQILPTYRMRVRQDFGGGTAVWVWSGMRVKKDGTQAIAGAVPEDDPDVEGVGYLLRKDSSGWHVTNFQAEVYWHPELEAGYDRSWFRDASQQATIVSDSPGGNATTTSAGEAERNAPFHTVVIESLDQRTGHTQADAESLAAKVRAAGLRAGVLDSTVFKSLRQPYWVVYSGIYKSESEAQAHVTAVKAAGYPDAYARFVDFNGPGETGPVVP